MVAKDWLNPHGFENIHIDPPFPFQLLDLTAVTVKPALESESSLLPANPEPLPVDAIRLLADTGQWDAAFTAADRLVAADPLDASAQFTLGLILEHSGSGLAACAALKRAIYLDRGLVMAHYHLATALNDSGDTKGARRSFATVLRILSEMAPSEPMRHGDGITAQELSDLAKMHLELIAE
jgi:chemotaxis protein methyltransferase CheR